MRVTTYFVIKLDYYVNQFHILQDDLSYSLALELRDNIERQVKELDIIGVKVENRKIVVIGNEGEVQCTTIKQLERLLSPYGYIKIDQSTLVKLEYIKAIEGNKITFSNSDLECFASRRNIKRVKAEFDKIRQG